MSEYLTDQQQLEQLHQWWKKNGTSTILILILAISISLGWHYWLQHREVKLERGSAHYEALLNAVVNEDDATAQKEATLLRNNYLHTPYAALASLMLARGDVYQNNYNAAKEQLNWVMLHANTPSLRQVARLRLARILIEQKQPQQALQLLQKIDDPGYLVVVSELQGDCYVALNQPEQAIFAYQRALTILPGYANYRPILRMKLDNLVGSQNTAQTTLQNIQTQ